MIDIGSKASPDNKQTRQTSEDGAEEDNSYNLGRRARVTPELVVDLRKSAIAHRLLDNRRRIVGVVNHLHVKDMSFVRRRAAKRGDYERSLEW